MMFSPDKSFWYEAASDILKSALDQTSSQLGMIGLVDEQSKLSLMAVEGGDSLAGSEKYFYEAAVHHMRTAGCLDVPCGDNLIGRCVTQGAAVIANAVYKDRRASRRLPDGHPALSCFLGLPILHKRKIIGMIGVANRAEGYSWVERNQLEYLTEAVKALLRCFAQRQRERDLEDQLTQAHKMEALGKLVGGVSHDFNNMLTVIMGHCELAAGSTNEASRAKSMGEIRKASGRAQSLIQQLMAFARRQTLQCQVLDVGAMLQSMGDMLQRIIGSHIDFSVSSEPDLGRVLADRDQLERVIMNIVINARDAMPTGGQLRLSAKTRDLPPGNQCDGVLFSGRYVEITVSDSGHGMDEQTRRKIFEPFFTTKPVGKGTGLGLSTAYGIVKQNHGYIFAESQPGHGCTFRVYLPVTDHAPARAAAVPVAHPATKRGKTILLVDDEEPVRSVIRQFLDERHYAVLEAGSGAEALSLAARHHESIDLVIADVMMPGETGCEVVARLKSVLPGVKVLYISGYTEDALDEHKILEEARPILRKPFHPDMLGRAVQSMFSEEDVPAALLN